MAANANSITINKSDLTLKDNSGMTVVGAVTLTTGTLNTNGSTESWGKLSSNNSNTRTLTLGASSITITAGGVAWDFTTTTGLTFNANTSTITFTGTSAQIIPGAQTFSSLVFSGSGQANINALTCTNFTRTGTAAKTDSMVLLNPITVTGQLNLNGNSSVNRLLIFSNVVASQRTITTTGAVVSSTNTDFQDIKLSVAKDFSAQTDIGDCGGNTNITFPASAQQTCTMSTNQNWSTSGIWTSRVPLPQDDVVMTGVTGGTLTADMPRLGRSIDWTGATGSPTWSFSSTANTIFGSVTLISGMTISGIQALTLAGRGSYTLTSAGKAYSCSLIIAAPGGTYTLNDAIQENDGANGLSIRNGTFNSNGFNVTCDYVFSNYTNTRSIIMGTSIWNLTQAFTTTSWDTSTTTGLTFSGLSATIVISTTYTNTRAFKGGGLSFGTLTYTVAGSTGALQITGSNTFNTINFSDASNARTLQFTAGTTTTITGGFNVNGTAGKLMTINSSSTGTAATLNFTGSVVAVDYLSITDNTTTGFKTYAGNHSLLVSNYSGWLYSTPRPDSALLFDGSQNYVSLGTMGSFGSNFGSGFYCKFDIKTIQTTNMGLAGAYTDSTGSPKIIIRLNEFGATGKITLNIKDDNNNQLYGYMTSTYNYYDGNKHTVILTANFVTKIITISVDGNSQAIGYVSQSSLSFVNNFAENFYIGAWSYNNAVAENCACTLDNFQIGTSSSVLYGSYAMNEMTGTSITDYSGNGNTGTLSGSPVPVWVTGLNGPIWGPTVSLMGV